jgi:hypothetical protein
MDIEPDQDQPSFTHWWMVSILCLVNAVSFIDRAAFILTYALGGTIVGAFVDRFARRCILSLGIAACRRSFAAGLRVVRHCSPAAATSDQAKRHAVRRACR